MGGGVFKLSLIASLFISSNLFGATINVVDKAKVESFDFSTYDGLWVDNNPFYTIAGSSYEKNLLNITDLKNTNNVGVYFNANISTINTPIGFDNSYLSGSIDNLSDITIKNSISKNRLSSMSDSSFQLDTGNKLIIENSSIDKLSNFKELSATNSVITNVANTNIINLTNSAITELNGNNSIVTVTNGGQIAVVGGSVNIDAKDKKVVLGTITKASGAINNSTIGMISSSNNLIISNSTISDNGIGYSIFGNPDGESNITLIDSVVDAEANGLTKLDAKGTAFNGDINVLKLTLNTSESGKQSSVKATTNIFTDTFDINKLNTGDKYFIEGSIVGEGSIKNSIINMQILGTKEAEESILVNQNNFYDNFNDGTAINTSSINLDNVIATNSVRAHTLNINNSKIAKRVLANNLTSNNTAYYLGANKESYTGAIISRENTSGANNELVLLNVMSDNKLDTSKINANLPLAILKKGTGTAELATFFKDYKISDGISDYVINNDYIASAMLGDYLTYAITTTKNGKVSDTWLNADNITSIANGDKTSALGKLVNQSAGDYDGDAGLKAALDNLAKQTVTINPENPSNPDTGVTNPENPSNPDTGVTTPDNKPEEKPDTNNPDTGVTNPENPSNPDTGVTTPDNKPDNKPNTGTTTPSDKNQIADDFIKDIKINKKAKAQAQVISNGIKLINTFAWNNMNKRLGEIRGLDKELGIWARAYYTNASIDDVKLNSTEVQFGADKANDFADGKVIAGIMANVSNSKSSDVLKSDNYGFGLYASYISNDDLYADLVIKANHYKVKYNSELLKDLKDSKTGFIASVELGKRFDLNRFYVEPSIEAIFDYTPKTNLENNAISITSKANSNLHLKPAIFSGFKVNDNANLRLGAGYIIDVNKPSDTKITAKSSKASEILEGKRDNKFYLNLTGDYKFNDNLRLNLGYERTFGADLNIDNQINAVIRYNF